MLASLVGSAARVVVHFSDADARQTISVRQPDGRDEEQFLFSSEDNVTGNVRTRRRAHLTLRLQPLRA